MRFRVPQFIDIEDKIFGPLTFKQFIYLIGGAGISYVLFKYLPILGAIPLIVIVLGLALALAFVRINNQPFVITLESAIRFFIQKKLYIWKRGKSEDDKKISNETKNKDEIILPSLQESKLKELSWSLDVLDNERSQKN